MIDQKKMKDMIGFGVLSGVGIGVAGSVGAAAGGKTAEMMDKVLPAFGTMAGSGMMLGAADAIGFGFNKRKGDKDGLF
jgi:hypothetical protein